MKRRNFIQTAALATVGSVTMANTPRTDEVKTDRTNNERMIGYAMLGLGSFASYVAPRIAKSSKSKIVALISGDLVKAKEWALRYNITEKNIYSYDNLEAISKNPMIDAVYIATPVGTHADFALRCFKAGKHVLTEKTMAATVGQAEQMIKAAEDFKRKLMVAYRARFEPFNQEAIKFAKEETYGKVTSIDAHKGFSIGNNLGKNSWRLSKKLAGGGALLDIGIYSIQACRYLAASKPVEVFAWKSNTDARFAEVDETVSFTIKFENGILATGSASWNYGLQNYYRVGTTKGYFYLDPATSNENLRLFVKQDSPSQLTELFLRNVDQIPVMFDHFSDCIIQDKTPIVDGFEGLEDLKVIEAIYKSIEERRPVTI
jgi:predicted dehydrogenase